LQKNLARIKAYDKLSAQGAENLQGVGGCGYPDRIRAEAGGQGPWPAERLQGFTDADGISWTLSVIARSTCRAADRRRDRPNGTGKTTLFRMITARKSPTPAR